MAIFADPKRGRIDLLKEWRVSGRMGEQGYALEQGVELTYPATVNAVGWYPIGFERGNDRSMEAMGWYGLKLSLVTLSDVADITVTAAFADDRKVRALLRLAGAGRHDVVVRPSDFEIEAAKANIWRFLQRFELIGGGELAAASFCRGDAIFVESDTLGKAGEAGEDVVFTMTVHNCTDRALAVDVKQLCKGWESLFPVVSPARFVLSPDGKQEVAAVVKVHEAMVPGGHESTTLQFTPNGDGASAVRVEFKTLRKLQHPYIYYNREQWRERRDVIARHAKFRPGYERILADADGWEAEPPVDERDYCYDTREEHYVMSAAYAYALTGDVRYAEKVAKFLRYFIDEHRGYPKKLKGCSQSYVQEGHFFQHLAIPYDIIYDSGVLSAEDHRGVERAFRIYMDILDRHLQRGHISNWLLSEITGALYCALAIQDIERALRFVFGPGGAVEQLQYGVFNDGWWHECSVGYNIWVSSMFIHTAHALLPFGINLLHAHIPIPFNDEVDSAYLGRAPEIRFGMYNNKWGGNRKNYVCIKDLFDATIPFLDYRGVLFGISDSDEKKLEGVHFGSTFDLAYTYYKDPKYIPVIRHSGMVDPIFGHAELPDAETVLGGGNAFADNVGIALLRSRTMGRAQRDQIQAVLRYGSHGYAHGHFDRTGLLSVMRYGRSFFNPEHVWWGYGHFMYKFYVQNSMTKNMVVVDEKVQVPSDSKRLLFYSGQAMQATAVETRSRWAYPPYGGMVYRDGETLEDRCRMNACSLPQAEDAPPYGELSDFTEPVRQVRAMVVTDDYIVLFDYAEGEREHRFDSLFQIKGFKELQAEELREVRRTSQWTDNPLSDAQFITDCRWFEASGTSVARFETIFGEGEDQRGNRTAHNEPGVLKMDVHTAWPRQSTQRIGRAAECHGVAIPLEYWVEVDGEVRAQGEFGAWLLGEGRCDVPIEGASSLALRVKNHPVYNEQKYPQRTKQALFWGEAYFVLEDGGRIHLSDLLMECDNIDPGCGIGRDYEGGRVTIVGNEYPHAIPTSPLEHDREGVIRVDLTGLRAVRFVGLIGADAFPGDEAQRRMTYGVQATGRVGRFVTIVEPYEAEPMVESVRAIDADTVVVTLRDGREQTVSAVGLDRGDIAVELTERQGGAVVRRERGGGSQ